MSYSFSLDDVAFLRSRHGEKALETVSGLALTPASMLSDITEVRSRYTPHDAALIETVRNRRRATSKLRDPAGLLLTDDGLQQATASVVAAHRAAEIATRFSASLVHDMTCSIGAELRELVRAKGISGVIGSDLDRVRLAMARHNVPDATLLVADALTPTSTADVLLADPARRSDAGRIFRLDQLTPPLLELLATYAGRTLIVKCAPGLDHQMLRNRFGFDGEVQVTSLDGGVREACLWSGPGVETQRRATVLRTRPDGTVTEFEITDHEDDDVPAGEAGEWIVDPDGAIVRAGLVKHYAHRFGLWQLDPQIAYLTGDSVPAGARGFRVIEQVGVTEKVLRKALAAHGCGPLEILVRGLDVDPDQLRKKLKPEGDRPLSVVLTRIGRKGTAFICEPGVRF
ncbi:UNVERIFIED_ORG: hypothetical protein L601_000600000210 [Gordonia westfalica J30]